VYELPLAFAIRPQTRPLRLQRSHSYVTFAGVGLQTPVDACRALPCTASPAISGCAVETSMGVGRATGPTRLAYAVAVPAASAAQTVRPIVFPLSRSTSVYVAVVAP